jgi:predicted permease
MSFVKASARSLRRTPVVSLVAIVSLAFGIGANVALFSLFDRMVLRPLPVYEPQQLVNLAAPGPKPGSQSCNQAGPCDVVFSYPMYHDLERLQQVFTGMAAHRTFAANVAYQGQTQRAQGMLVSGNYFQVLGLQPAHGRLLAPGDAKAVGESPVAVLSHEAWRTRFGQNPNVVGESLTVNGHALTIAGVAPAGFWGTTLGAEPQIFVPITLRPLLEPRIPGFDNRRNYWAYVFARLKPGISLEQARAALAPMYRGLVNDVEAPLQQGMSDQTMARFRTKGLQIEPGARGQSNVHREARLPLLMLFAVTGLVLVIACANIANLLLARAATRSGEIAVRLAIGASRGQVIRQLLTEACMLAGLGGLLGLAVAHATINLIYSLMPAEGVVGVRATIDATAMMFAAAVALGTGLLFGVFPAVHATRPDLTSTLKGQSGQASGSPAAFRFRTALVTTQIALSMTLLVASGLFIRSLVNLSRVDLGLQVADVVTFGVSPGLNGYARERSLALFERIEDELAATPGVVGVSASMVPALDGSSWGQDVSVEGFEAGPDTDANSRMNEVGPDYLRVMGIPLLAGREFTRADAAGAPRVALVNEQFAKKFNLGRDAVGKRFGRGRGSATQLDIEIVGLVKDAKYSEVKDPVPPLFFLPYRQDERLGALYFYVESSLPADRTFGAIRSIMTRVDPNLPLEDLRTMNEQVREQLFADRIVTVLSSAFAGLATLLAAIGLYGVLAYTVAQRTKEIGLRMALGAGPADIRRMVLQQVARMLAIGGVVGLAAAYGLGRAAQSLLFEIAGHDPIVFVGAALALAVVAAGAGYLPAQRAARVDPMGAIRYE